MDKVHPLPYIDAPRDESNFPLGRYLPPYYPQMITGWLAKEVPAGAVVLDPIGVSPRTLLELAARYRVIVNINNPVLAFLISFLTHSPTPEGFQSVLAELSTLKRGTERLEEHLKSLYLTRCSNCRQTVAADAFLWRKGESAPYARIYNCAACGDAGQKPVTDEDLERLVALQKSYPMHQARALERASIGTVDSQKLVEEVLNLYTPRAVYFIFTLLNKVEGMTQASTQRDYLDAMFLNILDAGHALNPLPITSESPRSLSQPAEYIERNLWSVMESTAEEWCNAARVVDISAWPDLPAGAGISLHRGRVRDLAATPVTPPPQAIVSVVTRPLVAFWTFSAVWSAWLWGKEESASFLGVLERRRFDWSWHSAALYSAFAASAKLVPQNTPFYGILPDPAPGLINATLEAASASGFQLSGIAYAGDPRSIQVLWHSSSSPPALEKTNTQRIIRDAIRQLLHSTGEPQPYTKLHTAVMVSLAASHCLPADYQQLRGEAPALLQKEILNILQDAKFLRHMETTSQDPELGTWWLAQSDTPTPSLSDNVESTLVEYLQQQGLVDLNALTTLLNEKYTGFLTPDAEYVKFCLASYAKFDPVVDQWILNEHDRAAKRAQDVENIQRLIRETGGKLGFKVSGENPIEWYEAEDAPSPVYRLYTSATAQIGSVAQLATQAPCQNIYLFPGSRAGLIKFKIDRDAFLKERTAEDWHFLKFRTMRHLAVRADLSREIWALLIDSDPISLEETTQLSMFAL